MSAEATVRRATLADLDAVLAIERACSEASHWSEATWRSILEPAEMASLARAAFVSAAEDQRLGFVVVVRVAGSAELENLAVRPESRRRGVAGVLCRAAIAWASAESAGQWATEMHLEVRAGNAGALKLYTGLGFVEQGRRGAYYQNPVEDAVLLWRSLESTSGPGRQ